MIKNIGNQYTQQEVNTFKVTADKTAAHCNKKKNRKLSSVGVDVNIVIVMVRFVKE